MTDTIWYARFIRSMGSRLSKEAAESIIADYEAKVLKGLALDSSRAAARDVVEQWFAIIR